MSLKEKLYDEPPGRLESGLQEELKAIFKKFKISLNFYVLKIEHIIRTF